MLYASVDGQRRLATTSGELGICPGCGGAVRARCGTVKVNHWAHVSGDECDSWYEPITQWHLKWQKLFPEKYREVVIDEHRADIHIPGNDVWPNITIEVQHSSISWDDVMERENFYKTHGVLFWVFDAREWGKNFNQLFRRLYKKTKHCKLGKFSFEYADSMVRWKYKRKSLIDIDSWCFFDIGKNYLVCFIPSHKNSADCFSGYLISPKDIFRFIK